MLKQKTFQEEKLEAAYLLLVEDATTLQKIEKIKTLLKGFDPKVDKLLEVVSKASLNLDKLQKGELISLSAEALPEKTELEKKRKKALLLFFSHWKSLKSEVARVKRIYSNEEGHQEKISSTEQISKLGNILGLAKGPLGLITLGAVVVVGTMAYLNASSVEVNIKNIDCPVLNVDKTKLPVPIPGLKLPEKPIQYGESALAKVPPLKANVDATNPTSIYIKVLGYNFSVNPGGISNIILDGQPILGARTQVNLDNSKTHTLGIKCSPET